MMMMVAAVQGAPFRWPWESRTEQEQEEPTTTTSEPSSSSKHHHPLSPPPLPEWLFPSDEDIEPFHHHHYPLYYDRLEENEGHPHHHQDRPGSSSSSPYMWWIPPAQTLPPPSQRPGTPSSSLPAFVTTTTSSSLSSSSSPPTWFSFPGWAQSWALQARAATDHLADEIARALDQAAAALGQEAPAGSSLFPFSSSSTTVTPWISTWISWKETLITTWIPFAVNTLQSILWYKPPVGIVSFWCTVRLLWTRRLFVLFLESTPAETEAAGGRRQAWEQQQQQLHLRRKQDREERGRSYQLDPDDVLYQTAGGIDPIRRQLTLAALSSWPPTTVAPPAPATRDDDWSGPSLSRAAVVTELVRAVRQALTVTRRPGQGRIPWMQESLPALAQVEYWLARETTVPSSSSSSTTPDNSSSSSTVSPTSASAPKAQLATAWQRRRRGRGGGSVAEASITDRTMPEAMTIPPSTPNSTTTNISDEEWNQVIAMASLSAEVRGLDALVRVGRDRLLKTSYRLARTRNYWRRRVQILTDPSQWVQELPFLSTVAVGIGRPHLETDRWRLSLAEAAYQAEIDRLGRLAALLMERPPDVDSSFLLQALKETREQNKKLKESMSSMQQGIPTFLSPREEGIVEPTQQQRSYSWRLPVLPRLSFLWHGHGMGSISLRMWNSDSDLDGASAARALLSDPHQHEWVKQAREWTAKARRTICQILRDSLQASESTGEHTEQNLDEVARSWCSGQRLPIPVGVPLNEGDHNDNIHPGKEMEKMLEKPWSEVLRYVDNLPRWRRIGEGKAIRLTDAPLLDWIRRLDIMGIPSTLLVIWAAHHVHRWIMPKWPYLQGEIIRIWQKAAEIFVARAWTPFKGIVDDIMNRSKGIMSSLPLEDEQTSLDHMLRDLGFGDGTPASRTSAMQKATEQYERDLRTGLLGNFLRGRLVRLLLVQVQQLKVGLLSALDTIDVLMQGNRIHFQLLAAVPAVLVAVYGTRVFFSSLYNIRARDLRPVTVVHSEMAKYLLDIDKILLLSAPIKAKDSESGSYLKEDHDESHNDRISLIQSKILLQEGELGEILLNMHRYLTLLDFGSPPFPITGCDQIHQELRELLGTHGTLQRLSTERHRPWLSLIRQEHQELLQYL